MWESQSQERCTPEILNLPSASAVILYQGIGDTIRVSLTGDPVQEIYAAKTDPKIIGTEEKAGFRWCPVRLAEEPRIDLISLANQK